jgi:hypothetical protein
MGCSCSNHGLCEIWQTNGVSENSCVQVGALILRGLSFDQSQRPSPAHMLETLEALMTVFTTTVPVMVPRERDCIVCLERPIGTRLLPCRHSCLCVECARTLQSQRRGCPLDRAPIERIEEGTFDGTFAP